MTASKKLSALADLAYPDDAMERSKLAAIRGRTLLDALPQIVAVVQAAEAAGPEPALIRPLRAALAALDEVLP